ncbi:MAG: TVP38/TMEM64 family protein [Patescibacteria group bacterium]
MKWQKLQKITLVAFLILIISSLFLYQILGDGIDVETIRQYLKDFGIWAPLIFIMLYTFGTIFIPSTPFMAIAGILFGFKYGLAYTIIGGFLSSIIVFTISRKLGKDKVDRILEHKYLEHLSRYNKRLEEGAVWDLIILRATPIMPFNVLNILMGVSKIKTEDYIIGTMLGLIPSNILTVYFGDIISKIF